MGLYCKHWIYYTYKIRMKYLLDLRNIFDKCTYKEGFVIETMNYGICTIIAISYPNIDG